MSPPADERGACAEVAVIGLGYVGLTLAVAFAEAGLTVVGYEADPGRRDALRRGEVPFVEPGLAAGLRTWVNDRLRFVDSLGAELPRAVVLCVGTPVEPETHQIHLEHLRGALDEILPKIGPDTLLVVRSTVPVGTSRRLILEPLTERLTEPLVAFCPERTIQGIALEELRSLPQVVGGSPPARARAAEVFGQVAADIVEVSSLEVAELVKLVNNSHTDLIYGFGNEVAMIAGAIGVDAAEVIMAANLKYPRPDVSSPGYVGGSCLTKDPYILLASARERGYEPVMVSAARRLNERVPVHVAERVLEELGHSLDPARATVLVSGMAYKGRPETDDVRGSAVPWLVETLATRVGRLLGHDFVVEDSTIARLGLEPSGLREGAEQAHALIVLNNHRAYSEHPAAELSGLLKDPAVVYDLWGALVGPDGRAPAGVYLTLADERPRG